MLVKLTPQGVTSTWASSERQRTGREPSSLSMQFRDENGTEGIEKD
jgi:hypothetical protein